MMPRIICPNDDVTVQMMISRISLPMLKLVFMLGFIKVINFRMIVTLLLHALHDDILKLKLT